MDVVSRVFTGKSRRTPAELQLKAVSNQVEVDNKQLPVVKAVDVNGDDDLSDPPSYNDAVDGTSL